MRDFSGELRPREDPASTARTIRSESPEGVATLAVASDVEAEPRPELESRLSLSRSARISAAVWHLSLGPFRAPCQLDPPASGANPD